MPVVELHRRAAALASSALRTTKSEDLELAFVGDARGAFLWLQCFIAGEDGEWCRTRGCPGTFSFTSIPTYLPLILINMTAACITTTTLSTESHIRLTLAASLLSTASPSPSSSSSCSSSPIEEAPNTTVSPALPPLPQLLPALAVALADDPFWGADYVPHLLERATQLADGIRALMDECVSLEAEVSSPTSPVHKGMRVGGGLHGVEEQGMKLLKSKLAKRQLQLHKEEEEFMKRGALQCWGRAEMGGRVRGWVLGIEDKGRRGSVP